MIVLLAAPVLMNVLLRQYQKVKSTRSILTSAPTVEHAPMFVLQRLFILHSYTDSVEYSKAAQERAALLFFRGFLYLLRLTFLSLSELVITETELKLIASAAIMGERSTPNNGYSTPAATGIPKTL
jgi:hypothetical protein